MFYAKVNTSTFFSPLLCSLRCLPFFSLPNRNSRTRAGSLWPIDFSIGCMYTVSRCTLSCVCLSGSGHSQTRKSFSRSYTEMDVSSFSRFCLCSHREILPAQNRGSLLFRRFSSTETLKGTGFPPPTPRPRTEVRGHRVKSRHFVTTTTCCTRYTCNHMHFVFMDCTGQVMDNCTRYDLPPFEKSR